ncbi:hypothetical protein GCM10010400_76820 [Streptomyces aculeolatus]|uniref:hypothetical protein n=1 Tax=Streptomyces aculeolatus TaxID=270689 RepID=UPI001CED4182|nr:hypothetical protein [Streptomyces aculeolatus]
MANPLAHLVGSVFVGTDDEGNVIASGRITEAEYVDGAVTLTVHGYEDPPSLTQPPSATP